MPAITTIRLRRGTATQWTSANPVLGAGEVGVETNTRKFKFGNGTTAWNSLDYAVGSVALEGVVVPWEDVTGKPTEFPPEAHTHVMADITDLEFPPTTVLSDTAPANPVTGTRWIKTTNFIEYIFYDSYWVEV
jgi:hypothetical protein